MKCRCIVRLIGVLFYSIDLWLGLSMLSTICIVVVFFVLFGFMKLNICLGVIENEILFRVMRLL